MASGLSRMSGKMFLIAKISTIKQINEHVLSIYRILVTMPGTVDAKISDSNLPLRILQSHILLLLPFCF